jgi:hypothetical protein
MNFDFTEEQIMLRDSVARFVQDDYDFTPGRVSRIPSRDIAPRNGRPLRNSGGFRSLLRKNTGASVAPQST